jgi:hypothetical protein
VEYWSDGVVECRSNGVVEYWSIGGEGDAVLMGYLQFVMRYARSARFED